MTTLTADSVMVRRGARQVLGGVYLEARAGEVHGILGPNGAGKTTLFRFLLGECAGSGSVRLDDALVSRTERLRHFAYLPQESFLPLDLPVWRGLRLFMGAGPAGLCDSDPYALTLLNTRAGDLSFGQRRYVECLSVLSLDRPVYLLDEPFSRIEPIHCEALCRYIKAASIGRVVLLTDHLYQDIQKVATRLGVLRAGTLAPVDGSRESLGRYGYLP